ncbi:hypothetical protein SS1G_09471 [Sclerotinia sclerotiorum 1980 UF-70]|uniref:DUF7587 domain-containing protein n=1 Tax=Sclerotinia sclerotiorum (strain ATCC 18683 / 1980 / Ss-1) TaxID=665079 RepID=A7EVW2_SCLS1|nr:hypothetical protein SS1G_09471 [Sclerotinia sclerotiorum 1980 UF-70]EDN93604.1 hypothetical protein SS1G_09471 [Sclerotinia sclerotiorum 1980 UF-70]
MASNVDAITDLVEGLRLTDNIYNDGHIPGHSSSTPQGSIQLLIQTAKLITSQAKQIQSLASSAIELDSLDITGTYSLYRSANELTEITRMLNDAAERLKDATELSIISHLSSLRGRGEAQPQNILSHFDKEIRSIIQSVLKSSSDNHCILWKIAEECYNQATITYGKLHPDNYFITRGEASLQWPYDPDYQAEEYYEHEELMQADQGYARMFEEKFQRMLEEERRNKQSWVDFWVAVLNNCPNGPTLFNPPASCKIKPFNSRGTGIPQYLFRAFDKESSGRNDDKVIASIASSIEALGNSRSDLLSLPKREATVMLHAHLDNGYCDGYYSDNLMSWTSSLLFAIQCAIWRRRKFGCSSSDIKICVVNTKRFPQGQFMPDMWLLQEYLDTAVQMGGKTQQFFNFRLKDERYHNGEYLSQGSLNHTGRSCVISLKLLEESGLYNLYPELGDVKGMDRWAKRVLELRQGWSTEQGNPKDGNKSRPEWDRRPDEVRRYESVAESLKSRNSSTNHLSFILLPT